MEIHGDECVYIFPDLVKAVSGTYRRGSLVSGFTYDVVDFVVPDVGLPFPVLSTKKQGVAISRSESTARDDKEALKYDGVGNGNGSIERVGKMKLILPVLRKGKSCILFQPPLWDDFVRRTMTALPVLRDEYETGRVEVRQSTLNSKIAGEGLFALRDFKLDDIVAFYNGVKGMCSLSDTSRRAFLGFLYWTKRNWKGNFSVC